MQAFLVEATDTWTLQVKYVQPRDAGQYECQVSTEPKMSHFITLNVVGKSLHTYDAWKLTQLPEPALAFIHPPPPNSLKRDTTSKN